MAALELLTASAGAWIIPTNILDLIFVKEMNLAPAS